MCLWDVRKPFKYCKFNNFHNKKHTPDPSQEGSLGQFPPLAKGGKWFFVAQASSLVD
jgi:hypothetical protein